MTTSTNVNKNLTQVLLVEDDPINQLVAGTFMREWGMGVSVANNGREAITLILKKTFQLILMDIQMPIMNGFEATSTIRSMDDLYFKTVPIVAFTSSGIKNIQEEALLHGYTDVLDKSFVPEELLNKINEHTQTIPSTRPIFMDFEMYTDGDLNFKVEMISLVIGNVRELQQSLFNVSTQKDPGTILGICHKVKPTISMLQDKELEGLLEELKALIIDGHEKMNATFNKKRLQFNKLCDHVIQSLITESNKSMNAQVN